MIVAYSSYQLGDMLDACSTLSLLESPQRPPSWPSPVSLAFLGSLSLFRPFFFDDAEVFEIGLYDWKCVGKCL